MNNKLNSLVYAFLLLCISFSGFSQNSEKTALTDSLLLEGVEYFEAKEFGKAKERFSQVIAVDSTHKDAWYNLAVVELNLRNGLKACEMLRRGYAAGNINTRELLKKYCGGISYQEYMFIQDVEELPKFYYKGKVTPLFLDGYRKINPKLVKLFEKEFDKSTLLRDLKIDGVIKLQFIIGKDGSFNCKIKQELQEEVKKEIMNLFKTMTTYLPAQFDGKDVGLINGHFALPLSF